MDTTFSRNTDFFFKKAYESLNVWSVTYLEAQVLVLQQDVYLAVSSIICQSSDTHAGSAQQGTALLPGTTVTIILGYHVQTSLDWWVYCYTRGNGWLTEWPNIHSFIVSLFTMYNDLHLLLWWHFYQNFFTETCVSTLLKLGFLLFTARLMIFTIFVRVALINVSKVIFNYARVSSQSQETRPGPGVSSAVLEILYNISTSTQQQHNIQYSLVF